MEVNHILAQARQLQEAVSMLDKWVDPRDALRGEDGEWWNPIGLTTMGADSCSVPYRTSQERKQIVSVCRRLALENDFAKGGHENRISYIVGEGHKYTAVSKPGEDAGEELLQAVQAWLDEWVIRNRWQTRQKNIVHRNDRDGETFLRYFHQADGQTLVRFIDPERIDTPLAVTAKNVHFGIVFDEEDAETVTGYYVDGQLVDASDIQHRKYNVDMNWPRGLPLFWGCRKNLIRADKILRNMASTIEVQSTIALIRKHAAGLAANVNTMVSALAVASVQNQTTGQTHNFQQFAPGTIIDHGPGTEYEYPIGHIDPSKPVAGLQACLRAVASSVVMPEFMLTSDASNANYSSTLVAEGPAVKRFEREQAEQIQFDLELIRRSLAHAVAVGTLPAESLSIVIIEATPPQIISRNKAEETNRDAILSQGGVLSPQTWASRNGLDYEQEQENIELHNQLHGGTLGMGMLPGGDDDDGGKDEPENDKTKKPSGKDNPDEAK